MVLCCPLSRTSVAPEGVNDDGDDGDDDDDDDDDDVGDGDDGGDGSVLLPTISYISSTRVKNIFWVVLVQIKH